MKNIALILIIFSIVMLNLPAFAGNGQKYTYHTCPSVSQASIVALNSSMGQQVITVPINGLSYQVRMSVQHPSMLSMSVDDIKNKGGTFFRNAVEIHRPWFNNFICQYILPAPNALLSGVTDLILEVQGKTLCKAQLLKKTPHQWQMQMHPLIPGGSIMPGGGIMVRYCGSNNPADCPFKCQ